MENAVDPDQLASHLDLHCFQKNFDKLNCKM